MKDWRGLKKRLRFEFKYRTNFWKRQLWFETETWRRYRHVLTFDRTLFGRLALWTLYLCLFFLLAGHAKGIALDVVLAAGLIGAWLLMFLLSVSGWKAYWRGGAKVIQEEIERMEADDKEWYLNELFGDGKPPARIREEYGEPSTKEEKER